MGRMPNDRNLKDILSELRDTLDQLEEGAIIDRYDQAGRKVGTRRTPNLGHLFILMSAARRDGWRTRSFGGGAPSSVLDDQGVPMPPLSDPVGEVAADDVKITDPIRVHAERLFQNLAHALHDMRVARGSMIAAFEDVKPEEGAPACRPHAEAGIFYTADRNGRCDWCYRFWLAEGQDPPPDLIRAKAEGKRITVGMVEEALRRPAHRVIKRKKVVA